MKERDVTGYVAGTWMGGRFVPMAMILKFGNIYKVKSNAILRKDRYGHITMKMSKFYPYEVREGETNDITNLLQEFHDAGFDIIEIHDQSPENAYDITPSSSDFPATI